MDRLEGRAFRRTSALKEPPFLKSENLALREGATEQILQVLKTSLAVLTYTLKGAEIRELILYLVCERKFCVTLLNVALLLQSVFDNSQADVQIP